MSRNAKISGRVVQCSRRKGTGVGQLAMTPRTQCSPPPKVPLSFWWFFFFFFFFFSPHFREIFPFVWKMFFQLAPRIQVHLSHYAHPSETARLQLLTFPAIKWRQLQQGTDSSSWRTEEWRRKSSSVLVDVTTTNSNNNFDPDRHLSRQIKIKIDLYFLIEIPHLVVHVNCQFGELHPHPPFLEII